MIPGLTPREHDVLVLLPFRLTYEEIGHELGISKNTVKTHAYHIFGKFGVRTRREAVTYALGRGFTCPAA